MQDFHTKNIIQPSLGPTHLIDWGSSQLGHPYYDVAKLTYPLSTEEALTYLHLYLEREPKPEEIERFVMLRAVVCISVATNRLLKGDHQAAENALEKFDALIKTWDSK